MKPKLISLNIGSTAFQTGFINGLGASVLLFSDFNCPTVRTFDEGIGERFRAGGLQQDWDRIGGDFRVAVNRHVEAA